MRLLPVFALGLTRPAAAGAATALIVVLTTCWGFVVHGNLRWRFGVVERLIATPALHRWRHTNDEHRDHNLASTLPVFDRVFGTLHLRRRRRSRFSPDCPTAFPASFSAPCRPGAPTGRRAPARKSAERASATMSQLVAMPPLKAA